MRAGQRPSDRVRPPPGGGAVTGGPRLTTVILSWNRADLLARTIESYLATVTVPYELVVVDNGSSDGSPDVIRAMCGDDPRCRGVLLAENLGGEGLNVGFEGAAGEFLQVA